MFPSKDQETDKIHLIMEAIIPYILAHRNDEDHMISATTNAMVDNLAIKANEKLGDSRKRHPRLVSESRFVVCVQGCDTENDASPSTTAEAYPQARGLPYI